MNKKIKQNLAKALALGVASVFALGAFAACGDDEDSDPSKLTFWFWGSPAEVKVYTQLIAQYEREHPGITIGYTHYESNTYMDKLLAERKWPDVFFMPDTDFLPWADAGKMLALDSYVTQAELDNVWDKAIEEYRYDYNTKTLGTGALYGFPKDLGPTCLTYNVKLLDSQIEKCKDLKDEQGNFKCTTLHGKTKEQIYAEYLNPKDPMSWNEFRAFLKDLTADQNKNSNEQIYGIPYYELEAALYSNNANYFTDDARTQKLDDRFIEALTFNIQLATVDKIMPDASRAGGTDAYTRFFNSKTIFTWMGPWDNADFWDYKDLEYNIIPAPYNDAHDDTKSVSHVGSMCYGVSSATKRPDTAVEFAKWISMSQSCQETAMKLGQQVPNLKSMVNDFVDVEWDVLPKNRTLFVDIMDDTNVLGLYADGEKDMVSGKTRALCYTYNGTWKTNLLSMVDTEGLWKTSDANLIRSKIEGYRSSLQADLDAAYAELIAG